MVGTPNRTRPSPRPAELLFELTNGGLNSPLVPRVELLGEKLSECFEILRLRHLSNRLRRHARSCVNKAQYVSASLFGRQMDRRGKHKEHPFPIKAIAG